eukprot:11171435-Lingulodinium_polyedra.AAC.1
MLKDAFSKNSPTVSASFTKLSDIAGKCFQPNPGTSFGNSRHFSAIWEGQEQGQEQEWPPLSEPENASAC